MEVVEGRVKVYELMEEVFMSMPWTYGLALCGKLEAWKPKAKGPTPLT